MRCIEDRKRISNRCGTAGYIAPEVFTEDWTEIWSADIANVTKTDVFSFGIMMYATTLRKNPFYSEIDEDMSSVYRRNARGLVPLTDMAGRSDELQSLILGLCAKDPRKRFSSSEALAHPWFSADLALS